MSRGPSLSNLPTSTQPASPTTNQTIGARADANLVPQPQEDCLQSDARHGYDDQDGDCAQGHGSTHDDGHAALHADVEDMLNVAASRHWSLGSICPAIYGGFQIGVHSERRWRPHRVPVPKGLVCAIFVPEIEGDEKRPADLGSRGVLRKDAIFNVGRCALMVNSFCNGDFSLFSCAM